jgi:hypothetical protein
MRQKILGIRLQAATLAKSLAGYQPHEQLKNIA